MSKQDHAAYGRMNTTTKGKTMTAQDPAYTSPTGKPTVKWNGHSLTSIRDAQRELGDIAMAQRVMVRMAKDATRAHLATLASEVSKLTGFTEDGMVFGQSWDCPGSPTLLCVYNVNTDPYKDRCLFCNDPLERR